MPIIQVHLMEGRSDQQKANLVKKMTEAVCETVDVPPQNVRIILSDMKPENYAIAGTLISDNNVFAKK